MKRRLKSSKKRDVDLVKKLDRRQLKEIIKLYYEMRNYSVRSIREAQTGHVDVYFHGVGPRGLSSVRLNRSTVNGIVLMKRMKHVGRRR